MQATAATALKVTAYQEHHPRVRRSDPVELRRHQASEHERADGPQDHAADRQAESFTKHKSDDRPRRTSQGHAHANLAPPLRHEVGEHAVQANRREEQRNRCKEHRQLHRVRPRHQRQLRPFGQRPDVEERYLAVDPREGRAHIANDGRRLSRGTNDEPDTARGRDRVRKVEGACRSKTGIGHRSSQVRSADDADHREPGRVRVEPELTRAGRPEHPAADRVAIGPEAARQSLVDDDRRRGRQGVALIEVPAANEGRAHGFEVAGRDKAAQAADGRLAWLWNISLGEEEAGLRVASEGNDGRRAGGGDARKLPNRLERPIQERARGVIGRVARVRQGDGSGDHVLHCEPRVHGEEIAKADPQQRGAHEQHERACHLRNDQRSPRHPNGAPSRSAPCAFVQHRSESHGVER